MKYESPTTICFFVFCKVMSGENSNGLGENAMLFVFVFVLNKGQKLSSS